VDASAIDQSTFIIPDKGEPVGSSTMIEPDKTLDMTSGVGCGTSMSETTETFDESYQTANELTNRTVNDTTMNKTEG